MATIIMPNVFRALDISGIAVPGALATFYNSGTTSQRTVYADPECTIPHPVPLAANGAGVFPAVYDTGDADVGVAVTTASGAMLSGYPIDPVPRVDTTQTGADGVRFSPTVDIPVTTVQAAIERVQENIVAPLADFGLGVTGNSTLLADIDNTSIASGSYRFDDTTVGTFPDGVNLSEGGVVQLWRQNATHAIMFLSPRVNSRVYLRGLLGGTYREWTYGIRDVDAATQTTWNAGASTLERVISPEKLRLAMQASELGRDQTWQLFSRARETVYTNGTGKPIMVSVEAQSGRCQVSPNGTTGWVSVAVFHGNIDGRQYQSFIVPAGHRYRLTGEGDIYNWAELR